MGVLDDAIREHLDLKRRRGADPAEIEKAEQDALGPVRREMAAATPGASEPSRALLGEAPETLGDDFDFDVDALGDAHPTTLAPAMAPVGEDDATGFPAADGELSELAEDDGQDPAISGGFDLPGDGPIAAMPPEAEKPKRRHLFHFRSHHRDDVFGDEAPLEAELGDDDPFAEETEPAALVPAPAVLPPVGPVLEPELPLETVEGEAVGRAQPLERDAQSRDREPLPEASEPGPAAPGPAAVTPPPEQSAPPALRLTPEAELGHTVEYDVEGAFAEEDAEGEDILEETPDFLADTPDHDRLWFEQKPPPDFDFES